MSYFPFMSAPTRTHANQPFIYGSTPNVLLSVLHDPGDQCAHNPVVMRFIILCREYRRLCWTGGCRRGYRRHSRHHLLRSQVGSIATPTSYVWSSNAYVIRTVQLRHSLGLATPRPLHNNAVASTIRIRRHNFTHVLLG